MRMIVVHDGSILWIYSSATNEYDAAPAGGAPVAEDPFQMWRFRSATDFVDGAKFLREETIEIGGAKLDCYVLTVFSGDERK